MNTGKLRMATVLLLAAGAAASLTAGTTTLDQSKQSGREDRSGTRLVINFHPDAKMLSRINYDLAFTKESSRPASEDKSGSEQEGKKPRRGAPPEESHPTPK